MEKCCFGVDIGGTSVKFGLFAIDGNVVKTWEIHTRKENSGAYILPDVAQSLKDVMEEMNITNDMIEGIGIGVPGPVTVDGTVIVCVNLGWKMVPVAEEVKKLTGIDNVKVNNDANVAALGEMWQGGGKGFENVVMVTLGTGVGGGIINEGKIITGIRGGAGEIGHITVEFEEKDSCNCGKCGCLEQYASATGIVKEAGRLLTRVSDTSVLREIETLTAKDIFDAAKKQDRLAIQLVEQLCNYLGRVLASVAATVDTEVFVIGGGVSKAGDILTETIEKQYDVYVMPALKGKKFKLAELGNDAGIYGCAKMVITN